MCPHTPLTHAQHLYCAPCVSGLELPVSIIEVPYCILGTWQFKVVATYLISFIVKSIVMVVLFQFLMIVDNRKT